MKRITVIVAVYNVEKYIEKCLLSICNQTYKNLEIIVVDDGSTDAGGSICDKIAASDTRIQVVHKKNAGVSSARNTGLKLATGDYVTFVDGDDYIDENMYEIMMEQLGSDKAQMAICSFRYIYHTKAKPEKLTLTKSMVTGEEYLDSLLKDAFGFYYSVVWNKLIRRELIVNNNILFDEEWGVMEDFRFVLQLLPQLETIRVCNEVLYNYRKNNTGTATNRQIPFEESYSNRKQGYLWLKECLEECGCYEQKQSLLADYLIRYLASQYAKAVFAENRREALAQHKQIKKRDFILKELNKASVLFRLRRKLYWNAKYIMAGTVQRLREIVRKR